MTLDDRAIPVKGSNILSAMGRRGVVGTPAYRQGWEDAVREMRFLLYGDPSTVERADDEHSVGL